MSETVRDISVGRISLVKPNTCIKEGKSILLCTIFGLATAKKTKEDRNGRPYTYLVGEFVAIDADGKEYEAEKLFLPGFASEAVESQIEATNTSVKFGYEFSAVPDQKSTLGWAYAAKTLFKAQENNVVSEMKKQLAEARKAQPAAVKGK